MSYGVWQFGKFFFKGHCKGYLLQGGNPQLDDSLVAFAVCIMYYYKHNLAACKMVNWTAKLRLRVIFYGKENLLLEKDEHPSIVHETLNFPFAFRHM